MTIRNPTYADDVRPVPLRAVLLDIDGTLLDSNDAHARSWTDALALRGLHVPIASMRRLIGMGGDKIIPQVTGEAADSAFAQALASERLRIFMERYLPGLGPTLGARLLVERIVAEGLRPVVATSAGDELPHLLRQADLDDVLTLRTSSDDAPRSKPDEDILVAALKTAGVSASEAVMVGDTPYDCDAARRASIAAIALRCGGSWSDPEFGTPVDVYDDPATLVAQWSDSALGMRGPRDPTRAPHRQTPSKTL